MWVISSYEMNVPRAVIRGMHLRERHLIRPPIGSTGWELHNAQVTSRCPRGVLIRTRILPRRVHACMSRHYHARDGDLTLGATSRGDLRVGYGYLQRDVA